MHPRRLLAPAVWLVATVVAAALVTGAIRLAVRGVSSPAAASRPSGGHPKSAAGSVAAAAGASAGDGVRLSGPRLRVTDGSGAGAPPNGSTTSTTPGRPASVTTTPPTTTVTGNTTQTTTSPTSTSTTTTTTPTTTTPGPTTTTSDPATTTTTQPTYVYRSTGGTVGVQCNGDAASLSFASPSDGYQTRVIDTGPDAVDVRFVGNSHVSEIRVTCSGGQPQPDLTEQSGGR